jgi:hypothetical protein
MSCLPLSVHAPLDLAVRGNGTSGQGLIMTKEALAALGMLERTGDEYANTAAPDLFLDRNKPSCVGGPSSIPTEREGA